MRAQRSRQQPPSQTYVEKALTLSKAEAELLQLKVRGRFMRRREDARISRIEALALNLEFEDKLLNEWRARLAQIRETSGALEAPRYPQPAVRDDSREAV